MATNPGASTDQGIIARAIAGVKYALTGQLPGWFGPGIPLPPQAPEEIRGRQYDFPVAININYRPRGGESFSFDQLKRLARNPIVAMLIQRQKDLLCEIEWRIKPKTVVDPDAVEDPAIAELTEFFHEPDKRHDWGQWISAVLDQLLVIDAVSIYARPTRGGGLYSLEVLDGAKIKPLLDELGHQPLPPEAAYQQELKGLPALDYTTEELIYFPQSFRADRLYGYSRVEQAADLIEQSLARLRSQLSHWTNGNVGEGYFEAPKEWTPDDIQILEAKWNQMMSGSIEGRASSPFVPNGTVWHETKTQLLADTYDEWLIRLLCFPFGVAPTPFMKQSGLGHGSASTDKQAAEEGGIAPLMQFVLRLMNRIIRKHFGRADLEFTWVEDRELDPQVASEIDDRRVKNASSTVNEVRDRNGEPPVEGGDIPCVYLPTGPIPLSEIAQMAKDAADARQKLLAAPPPGSEPAPGGKPGKAGKGAAPASSPDNPEAKGESNLEKAAARADKNLKRAVGSYLKKRAAEAADAITAKLGKAAPPMDDHSGRIEQSLDNIDWTWADLPPIVEPIIAGIAVAAGQDALSEFDLFDSAMLKRMTARATAFAQDRAAELVGMKWIDGELVANPSAEWSIAETTRDMLRRLISDAVESGASNDSLATQIREATAFSSDRAETIARTETGIAEKAGNKEGWRASDGAVAGRQWLSSPDCCDECQSYDGTIIGIDEEFDWGDEPHPNCRCSEIAVLPEDMPDGEGDEDEADKAVRGGALRKLASASPIEVHVHIPAAERQADRERTIVTKHDERGRIVEFVRVREDQPPPGEEK